MPEKKRLPKEPEPIGSNFENRKMGSDLIERYAEPGLEAIGPRVRGFTPEDRQEFRDFLQNVLPGHSLRGDIELPAPKKPALAKRKLP